MTSQLSRKGLLAVYHDTYLANGEEYADWAFGKLTVPDSNTCSPGTNFRLFGLGVSCTWINMVLILAGMKDLIKKASLILQIGF